MQRILLLVFAVLLLATGTTMAKTHSPWELIASGFGGATRSIHYGSKPGEPPALFLSGDVGGAYRSLDCGQTWEPANGGPAVTDGLAGGYPNAIDDAEDGSTDSGCDCDPAAASCPVPPSWCHHGMVVGGPPGGTAEYIDTRVLVSGTGPASVPLVAGKTLIFRDSHFSHDAGDNWYPLTPACVGIIPSSISAMASDPGDPRRMIVAAGNDVENKHGLAEASACPVPPPADPLKTSTCAVRQIAWTADVSPQMSASLEHSQSASVNTTRRLDHASEWRYSSLNHLAVSTNPDDKDACAPVAPDQQPKANCQRDTVKYCGGEHGGKTGTVEGGCLLASDPQCRCNDPKDADDKDLCKYPVVSGLQYDPRNGWVYASTDAGLLMSIDGGRSWGRHGIDPMNSSNVDTKPALLPAGPGTVYPVVPGVVLATKIPTGVYDDDSTAFVYLNPAVFESGYDLNLVPWRISRVGKMSMQFQEQACPTTGETVYANGRKRGKMTAYVPVSWTVKENGANLPRSSVFVAETSACDAHDQPLWFRDVNTMVHWPMPDGSLISCLVPEDHGWIRLPKLPRTQQYDSWTCYHPAASLKRCKLEVVAVAAAPSHPGIAYAILRPFNRTLVDSNPDCPGAASGCGNLNGVYQTVNGGETWHLVLGTYDLHAPNGYNGVGPQWDLNSITVSANNPYFAWASGHKTGMAVRIHPAPVTQDPPKPNGCEACGSCAPTTDCSLDSSNNYLADQQLDGCDRTSVVSNLCQQMTALGAFVADCPAGNVCVSQSNGVKPAGSGGLVYLPQCAHRFPSQPDTPRPVNQEGCVSCITPQTNCSTVVAPEIVSIQEGGGTYTEPKRCCLGATPLEAVHGPMQCTPGKGGSTPRIASHGGSEEAILDVTVTSVKDGKGVPSKRIYVGGEDFVSSASGKIAKIASAAGDGVFQLPHTWTGAGTGLPFKSPDAVLAQVFVNGLTPTVYALVHSGYVNKSAPDKVASAKPYLFQIAKLTVPAALDQVANGTHLGAVYMPTIGSPFAGFDKNGAFSSFDASNYSPDPGRDRAYHRLSAGPSNWLFAVLPGAGVFAVDRVKADASTEHTGELPGVTHLSFTGGVNVPEPGPVVRDVAWYKNWLFAAVGRCATSKCAMLAPGLWMRPIPLDGNWQAGTWTHVPSPWLGDPQVMKVVSTKTGPGNANVNHRLFVGNRSRGSLEFPAPEGVADCAGALYSLDLDALPNDIGSAPATAFSWKMDVRHDGIVALDASDQQDGVYIGVTAQRQWQKVNGVQASLGGFEAASGITARWAPANRPGVYRVDIDSAPGVVVANLADSSQPPADAAVACKSLAQATTSVITCKPTSPAGCHSQAATAARDGAFATIKTTENGLGKALLSLTDVLVTGDNELFATTYGTGTYRLASTSQSGPPPVPGASQSWGSGGASGTLTLASDFDPETDWRIEHATVRLRHQLAVSSHDLQGVALANETPMACPVGAAASCVPSTGPGGGSRAFDYTVPEAARSGTSTAFRLASQAGAAAIEEGILTVQRAALLESVPVVPAGSEFQFNLLGPATSAGRLRIHYTPQETGGFQLWLNGRSHGPFWPDPASNHQTVVLPATNLRNTYNTIFAVHTDGVTPFSLSMSGVDVAAGAEGPYLGHQPLTASATALHYVEVDSRILRRSSAWLVVTLYDAQRATMLSVNGQPALLAQDFSWVEGPWPAPDSSTVRIPLHGAILRPGLNEVLATTAVCTAGLGGDNDCLTGANVRSASIVVDADDDIDRCMPVPEVCQNGVDEDCNGATDDTAPGYCDGGDLDGCGLGHRSCLGGDCLENTSAAIPVLTPGPSWLRVDVASARFVFEGGLVVAADQPVAGDIELLAGLASGLSITVPQAAPEAMLTAVELILVRAGAVAEWQGLERVVSLRSVPESTNEVVRLGLQVPLNVEPGQPLFLRHASLVSPGPFERFFGCPNGEITYPEDLPVEDVCLFGGGTCGP